MIEIIPAMDLIGGRCVRLLHGDFDKETVYSEDPIDVARRFEDAGLRRLHMVDLDGARRGQLRHLDLLREVASATDLIIDFGGGVRDRHDVGAVLAAGAHMVTIGSLAVRSPELISGWAAEIGRERFLIGIDGRSGKAAIDGWQTDSHLTLHGAISALTELGFRDFFVTDISKDGAMAGPALGLYREILAQHPSIRLTASGGVRTVADIADLEQTGCHAVIVGRALYEGTILLTEVTAYAR